MARSGPKPRFARHPPEVRRQALIEATIECLKRYGHEGLSIRTISAQAGVSVGLINHHFPNKDELVAAAYRHINSELVLGMQAAVARAGSSPQARLRALLEAWFSAPSLDADALAVWVVFWGLYRHSRLIQRVHRETYQGYLSLLRSILAELLPQPRGSGPRAGRPGAGGSAAPVDLRLAAIGFTALLDGLWLEWCLEPGTFRPAEAVELCEAWIATLSRSAPRAAAGARGTTRAVPRRTASR
jgi:AcrR family transcriptional regulator